VSGADLRSVALVTGAASGIGFAVAQALCASGARVALCDRDEARLHAAADRLRGQWPGAELQTQVLDVRERAQVKRCADAVESGFGPIAQLALVAGTLHLGRATELSDQAWDDSFATNTTGAFQLARAIVPRMAARGRGALVAVASNAAHTPRMDMAAYAASKAALVMFVKCLGLEVARFGVRCNCVSPGSTDTPMQRALWTASGPAPVIAGDLERFRLGIPLGRIAEPSDIAAAVLFLLSDQARQITMQDLCVDGGATL
jgi:2,3-dihydro-2,3-dihydroxybenzoate dehydrogenase